MGQPDCPGTPPEESGVADESAVVPAECLSASAPAHPTPDQNAADVTDETQDHEDGPGPV
jgi:hypothetical protein